MAELITPPNRLLAKVGRLGVGPDAVAKAEAALRDMAEQFGLKYERVGTDGSFEKVKLIGDDEVIDRVAQKYGK